MVRQVLKVDPQAHVPHGRHAYGLPHHYSNALWLQGRLRALVRRRDRRRDWRPRVRRLRPRLFQALQRRLQNARRPQLGLMELHAPALEPCGGLLPLRANEQRRC